MLFRSEYPGANDGASFTQRSTGDDTASWVTKEDIRLAEYFYVKRVKTKLLQLSNGQTVYADTPDLDQRLAASGVQVVGTRESYRKRVHWCKMTAMEVLEEAVLPGRWIPIVPCYGAMVIIDDKRKKYGLVRFAKDPQRMYNFWRTSMTESVALDRKSTRLNSSHIPLSRMPSSA